MACLQVLLLVDLVHILLFPVIGEHLGRLGHLAHPLLLPVIGECLGWLGFPVVGPGVPQQSFRFLRTQGT